MSTFFFILNYDVSLLFLMENISKKLKIKILKTIFHSKSGCSFAHLKYQILILLIICYIT
jgi:hypothetical protein